MNRAQGTTGWQRHMDETETPIRANPAKRYLYMGLGLFFVVLGFVGATLPVLPTTPFMILALYFFAQSSSRLHRWLYNHRVFGPPLHKWREHRVVSPVAKAMSLGAMSVSITYLLVFSNTPWYLVAAAGAIMAYGAWFIMSKPGQIPDPVATDETPTGRE